MHRHQNWVPTLNVNNFVASPCSFSRALAISILNGPNGEFQLTPKPTDTRGLGVSPTYSSSKGGRTSVAPVGHFPLPSVPTRVPVVLLVKTPSAEVRTGSFNPNTAPAPPNIDGLSPISLADRKRVVWGKRV